MFKVDPITDPGSDRKILRWYTRFADQAFAGVPPRNIEDVVDNEEDFFLVRRRNKTLLLKEVNPLATEFFVRRYSPKVVLIVRHPAAVADSFERMGWLNRNLEEFGYLYGTHLAQAIEASKKVWSMVVAFEDLATDPLNRYPSLFSSLGVRLPAEFTRIVAEFCDNQNYQGHPYDVRRLSSGEINKWEKNLSESQINAVMKGHLRAPLEYYRGETAWR